MYAAVRVLKNFLGVGLGSFLIQVAAGVLVYGSLSLIYILFRKRELWDLVVGQFLKKKA